MSTSIQNDVKKMLPCTDEVAEKIEEHLQTYSGLDLSECEMSDYRKALNESVEWWLENNYYNKR